MIGYLRALSDNGILYDDNLVISGQYAFATGYKAIDTLLQLPDPPTAIFATNYDFTMGLITSIRERGLSIPDQIDIFGFDSVKVCSMMNPPLPVVHQPEEEIGRIAATYLIDRLSGYTGAPRISRLECNISR